MSPVALDGSGKSAGPAVDLELSAETVVGRKFVALAEKHAADFAQRAGQHDTDGSFPFDNIKEMQESSFLTATVPLEHGGIGLTSVHDIMVGISRLARGDASTAIAVNMHLTGVLGMARFMRRSKAEGDQETAHLLTKLLSRLGKESTVMCFPLTEPGTDHTSPFTEATPTQDGYLINGRKTFGTISPVAQLFFPTVRVPKDGGGYLAATAMVSRDTPGLKVEDNWDALGMRASGSNDVTFANCFIPSNQLFGQVDSYGSISPGYITSAVIVNTPLASTFLGVAEAAKAHALAAAKGSKGSHKRRLADRPSIQQLIAEIDIDLSVCRAMLERMGRLADSFLEQYNESDPGIRDLHGLMKEMQCMKYVVNSKSAGVVDRSMTVCGGRAYMTKHPLSRLYRDARAGSFMQPFAPHEALEYIGKVSLGLDPVPAR